MKKVYAFIVLICLSSPLFGGTEIHALAEGFSFEKAWIDLLATVDDGHVKIHFQGPWCQGALIYDRESSQLTIVDDLRKTVLILTQENQAALKLIGAVTSGKLISHIAGSTPSAQKTFLLVKDNVQAFFNGPADLKKSAVLKSGFTCDDFQAYFGGQKCREVWVTGPESAGIDVEDFNTLRSLGHLLLDLSSSTLNQLGADPTNIQQDLSSSIFPICEDLYSNGKHSGRFQVIKIRSGTINPGVFTTPSKYKIRSLLDLMNGS